jgi:hypothetical protein
MSDYPIADELLQQHHLAILATTGAGKSYLVRGLVERMRAAGWRNGIIDKLGNYWGLTLSHDGKSPGLEYVIFGGKRAHVPMDPRDGEKIGRLFVEQDIPAIFDLSLWKTTDQQIWVRDFCDAVFLHNEGSLHLIMDEIHSWVPQSGGALCAESVQRLATQGRGLGIKLVMAAQRPATVDKTVLYMASAVVAMRMVGRIDRKAIGDMFEPYVADVREIIDALPELKTGTGFLWDPVNSGYRKVSFPKNQTYDSSATPKHGDRKVSAPILDSELISKLSKLLQRETPVAAEDVQAAKADPAVPALKMQIRKLEEQNQAQLLTIEPLQANLDQLREFSAFTEQVLRKIADALQIPQDLLVERWPSTSSLWKNSHTERKLAFPIETTPGKPIAAAATDLIPTSAPSSGQSLPAVEKMVSALESFYPRRVHINDILRLTGISSKSSAWRGNLQALTNDQRVKKHGDFWTLSEKGRAALPVTKKQFLSLLAAWQQVLPANAARILEILHRNNVPMTREEIRLDAGISEKSSGLGSGLNELVRQELVTQEGVYFTLSRPLT